jgi:hypothetical protein
MGIGAFSQVVGFSERVSLFDNEHQTAITGSALFQNLC